MIPVENEVLEISFAGEGEFPALGNQRGMIAMFFRAGDADFKRATLHAERFLVLSTMFQGIADPVARMKELLRIEAGYLVVTDAIASATSRIEAGDKTVSELKIKGE